MGLMSASKAGLGIGVRLGSEAYCLADSLRRRPAGGQVPAAVDDGQDLDSLSQYTVDDAVTLLDQLTNVFILSFGNHPSQLGELQ